MNKYVTAQCVCVVETGLIQVAEVGKLFLVELIFDLVPFENCMKKHSENDKTKCQVILNTALVFLCGI